MEKQKISAEILSRLERLDAKLGALEDVLPSYPDNLSKAYHKSTVKYLQKGIEDIKATKGLNRQKYLPPQRQKIIFYPEFGTFKRNDHWGALLQKA